MFAYDFHICFEINIDLVYYLHILFVLFICFYPFIICINILLYLYI